jgi:thiol-disulfide isomerase/thioredoxin
MELYKKGLIYARENLKLDKGMATSSNNTYALLAEKTLPVKQYKKELEQFVKDGKSTADIKEVLKRVYNKEKKSDTGFDNYIANLEKASYLQMVAELRKSMLNDTTPSFALYDLDKNKVDIADLKNKIVVVDFWATWCGPCKASFPTMQKMVNKYKDDPNVKFVFVDTWENGENKQKDASDFIATNKYTFHVLLDVDNKVVEQFKVKGIPTKFILDKNGVIRFKSVGWDGDEKLSNELSAMIAMAQDVVREKNN